MEKTPIFPPANISNPEAFNQYERDFMLYVSRWYPEMIVYFKNNKSTIPIKPKKPSVPLTPTTSLLNDYIIKNQLYQNELKEFISFNNKTISLSSCIITSLDNDGQRSLRQADGYDEALIENNFIKLWEILKKRFQLPFGKRGAAIWSSLKQLFNIKMSANETIHSYIERINENIKHLELLECVDMPEEVLVAGFIINLDPKRYQLFMKRYGIGTDIPKSLRDTIDLLADWERDNKLQDESISTSTSIFSSTTPTISNTTTPTITVQAVAFAAESSTNNNSNRNNKRFRDHTNKQGRVPLDVYNKLSLEAKDKLKKGILPTEIWQSLNKDQKTKWKLTKSLDDSYDENKKKKSSYYTNSKPRKIICNNKVIYDCGTTYHIYNDNTYLTNIKQLDVPICIGVLGGSTNLNKKGEHNVLGWGLIDNSSDAVLISQDAALSNGFRTPYCESGDYHEINGNGINLRFNKEKETGLYILNNEDSIRYFPISQVKPMAYKAQTLTSSQIISAKKAYNLHQILGHPSNKKLLIGLSEMINVNITNDDLTNAELYYGKCKICALTKITKNKASTSKTPKSTICGEVVHMDIFYYCSVPFIMTIDEATNHRTGVYLPDESTLNILKFLNTTVNTNHIVTTLKKLDVIVEQILLHAKMK